MEDPEYFTKGHSVLKISTIPFALKTAKPKQRERRDSQARPRALKRRLRGKRAKNRKFFRSAA